MPSFVTHNQDNSIKVNGTHLQGYVDVSYERLVSLFGEPHCGDGYKVDAEWEIRFDDGLVATIYNYKNGKNYCGSMGLELDEISDWHIGGHDKAVVERVKAILSEPWPVHDDIRIAAALS